MYVKCAVLKDKTRKKASFPSRKLPLSKRETARETGVVAICLYHDDACQFWLKGEVLFGLYVGYQETNTYQGLSNTPTPTSFTESTEIETKTNGKR